MTIEEPQLPGAVVETADGRIWMRDPNPNPNYPEFAWIGRATPTYRAQGLDWPRLLKFGDPVVRFEGFKPRPKEPTLPCAVVRDKEKRLFIRSDDTAQPWRLHAKGIQQLTAVWFPWSQIPDPEVLFEGVPE